MGERLNRLARRRSLSPLHTPCSTGNPSRSASRRRFARRALISVLAAALTLTAAGCAREHPLDTLTAAGPDAAEINSLFFPVLGVAIAVFFLVQGMLIYLVIRYRVRRRSASPSSVEEGEEHDPEEHDPEESEELEEDYPEQVHGNLRLELAWTIIPTIILAVISVFTLTTLFKLEEVSAAPDDLRVTVVGQQWWWEFHYHLDGNTSTSPDIVTANELVIPVGQQVPLEITSRDVIHSFWIPRLNGKRDAVPGSMHPWVLEADSPGRYGGQCTEFCGLSHAYMRMYTIALEPEEWEVWLEAQMRSAPLLAPDEEGYEGQQVFLANCANCHVVNGVSDTNLDGLPDDVNIYAAGNQITTSLVSGAAPNLTHFASRTSFAGSIFDLYEDRGKYLPYTQLSKAGKLNRGELDAWIRNAPDRKANRPDDGLGMPAFPGLSDAEVNDLIDYLAALK